jgi:iron complex outermembrane receptor protein
MSCANPNGPLAFLGMATPSHVTRDVNAVYGELSLPVLDSLQVQAAARYESYGGQTGDTFNPKLSVRWQMTPIFALRGSVGSTFRAPALTQIDESFVTSLQNIAGTFRAVDIYGNPSLEPETAKTYSVGFIADVGGLNATIDYWNFDFDKPIVAEPVGGIVNTIFPNGAGAGDCTTNPDLAARFVLTGGVCNTSAIQRLKTKYINGPKIKTSGIDALAEYRFGDLGFAEVTVGGSLTYVREYKVGQTIVEGVPVAQPFDAVGFLNYQTTAYPLPQWKGEAHVELSRGGHTLRWTTRYIDSYVDQRTAPFAVGTYHGPDSYSNIFTVKDGKEIDSTVISDLTYRGLLPMDTTLVVSIENIFDEDPSFARLDLNYDPFTGDPLGRNFKVSVTKRF